MPIHFKDRNTTNQALADAGLGPTVDASIQLEEDMNAFRPRISLDHEIAVWKTYGDDGPEAARRLLTTIKEIKSPVLMRQKAAPAGDEFDQLGQQIADAARQIAMQPGGDRKTIIDQLRSYAMQLATPQKTTKAAAPSLKDLISNALDHVAREGIH